MYTYTYQINTVNQARLNGTAEASNASIMTKKNLREKDAFSWMTCTSKNIHDVEQLMLTQIVAGDSMNIVFSNLHEICTTWNIMLECGCPGHPFPFSQVIIYCYDYVLWLGSLKHLRHRYRKV